ncbi:MAG: heat shock protein Hsp20 [Verrucomicrobia bacterium]|nr:heat shock protein Hsp20 [Verrucomicrobiota bacterium]
MSLFNNSTPTVNRPAAQTCAEGGACATSAAVKPAYNVLETAEAYRVTVQLPGVAKDGLEITAENDELRITGRRTWAQPTGWTSVYRETPDANYELTLTHDNAIDADKIGAELRDGVLNVTLPKHEALKPRKIAVA